MKTKATVTSPESHMEMMGLVKDGYSDVTPLKYKIENIFSDINEIGLLDYSLDERQAIEKLEKLFNEEIKADRIALIEQIEREVIEQYEEAKVLGEYDIIDDSEEWIENHEAITRNALRQKQLRKLNALRKEV